MSRKSRIFAADNENTTTQKLKTNTKILYNYETSFVDKMEYAVRLAEPTVGRLQYHTEGRPTRHVRASDNGTVRSARGAIRTDTDRDRQHNHSRERGAQGRE